ncbi:MAG TPA: methyltransferase domain-containing protein [Gammaproteobacteria bacterium]|nr:methyltransferase domain-containing protein [Gammaproteobacteria bacterium]
MARNLLSYVLTVAWPNAVSWLDFRLRLSSALALWRELLRHPSSVGAILPSSPWLAQAIAAAVPLNNQALIIEIGAGTGAVTRALLARGIAPSRLLVVERSAKLCKLLRHRFPYLSVVHGDAAELTRWVGPQDTVCAIVSSLPLRSLPDATVTAIAAQMHELLATDGMLVQFTYGWMDSSPLQMLGFERYKASWEWRNIPPARIDVLCKA